MARQFTLKHLGNDVTFLIPEAVAGIAESGSQQNEYRTEYSNMVYRHFTHTPITNSPVIGVRQLGTPSQAVIDRRNEWASHVSSAKVLKGGSIQFEETAVNTVQLLNNNKFINPQNGRYLTLTGSAANPTWTVCEEDDTVVSTFSSAPEFQGPGEWWLICFDTFEEFCEASTWDEAQNHCWMMYITEPMQLIGDTDYDHFRYRIYKGTTSYSYFLHALYLLFGGEDPSEPEPEPEPDDPYNPYDPSGPNPGTNIPGNPYDSGDPINKPPLPGWDPSDSGFLKIFVPSSVQLHLLAAKLWDINFWETLNKFIADPRDAIISLGCVPFNITPDGTAEIKVGAIGTEVSANYVNSPYIDIDCGSVTIFPILGGYTDFAPFTQMFLTLPYIGSVQLDTDIYMGKTVNIQYRVDILTGDCIAYILVNNNVKATYNGNIRFSVPITSADYSQMWTTFLTVTTGALMGAAGAAAAGAEAGAVDVAQGAIKGGAGKLSQSAGIKPQIQMTGQLQSTNGLLGVQKPFIEIKRPNLCIPSGQKDIEGYPSLVSVVLSSLSGYTEVEEINLSVAGATREELEEIETLLKTGVII